MGRVISDGVLHAFVTEMIVHESMRGLGVGAELLRRIVERTVGRGITDIQRRDRPTRPRPPVTGSSSQHPNGC
jgi:GNAT superfamily N-acetyltransferase